MNNKLETQKPRDEYEIVREKWGVSGIGPFCYIFHSQQINLYRRKQNNLEMQLLSIILPYMSVF